MSLGREERQRRFQQSRSLFSSPFWGFEAWDTFTENWSPIEGIHFSKVTHKCDAPWQFRNVTSKRILEIVRTNL